MITIKKTIEITYTILRRVLSRVLQTAMVMMKMNSMKPLIMMSSMLSGSVLPKMKSQLITRQKGIKKNVVV